MYTQGSNEFNTLIETPNNQSLVKRLVLIDDGTEIENVLSVNLVSSSSQDELQIGTTNMAYIEVSAVTDKILTNREVRLECGVKLSNGTIEYAPIGVYTIQKPKGGIDGISFKANDKMQKFEKPYISSLAYPTTSDKVLEELCDMCGVELTTPIDNPISISEKLDGYTCREMLGYIAGIHAKFACFDRLGKLNLRWYNNIPIEKKIGLIYKFSKAENDFTVSKIELAKDAEIKYTSGSGFGAIYYSNPLATQEITDSIFSKLNGFTYNATSLDILDDIRLDLGDVIKVTYLDGMDYLVPCMSVKQNFSQGSTTIEAYSKTEEENEYKYTGPTTKYIERVAHELLIANRIIATKVDAEYVQAHAITTDNLEAITANITNLVVENIKGQYADIHLANIDIADIGQFFADSGLLKDVTIVEGHITGELDAVRINADVIKTGTLSVDRLLITGKDSIVYQINVDSSGLTKAELEDEVYQKYLNGTNIVANSITATQLNVSEIFTDKTVTNTLFAQNITATGSITGAKLYGAYAEIDEGNIGSWHIDSGSIVTITNDIIFRSTGALEYDLTDIVSTGSPNVLTYMTNGKEKLTLSAGENNVYLEFASVDNLERNTMAYQINLYGIEKTRWSSDFTTSTTKVILGYLDDGIYTPHISTDRIDVLNVYAKDVYCYNGTFATVYAKSSNYGELTIERAGSTNSVGIRFRNNNGLLGSICMSTVDGGLYRHNAAESESYKFLDASNYSDYVVPKSGGQFTGRIQVPIGQGGTYLDSVTNKSMASIYIYNVASQYLYHPIITGVTYSGHTWNLGAIGDTFGFSTFKADRTANGVDYYFWMDASNGNISTTFKVRATSIDFGSSYQYRLTSTGEFWGTNVIIANNHGYFCQNTSGGNMCVLAIDGSNKVLVGNANYATYLKGNTIYTDGSVVIPNAKGFYVNSIANANAVGVMMDSSNRICLGDPYYITYVRGGTINIGAYDVTTRTMIFGTRIDFCANTAGTSETNPAISLVSGAGGANLYFRPTSTQGVATYLGDVSYRFNTVYCQTLDQSSDKNDKKNICDISYKYIELWDKLSVKTFRYINDDKVVRVGLIAQDVEEWALKVGLTLEDCGFIGKRYVDNDTYKGYKYSIDYISMAMITMAKVKQIVDIINQHDKRIQELEDEIAILKARINHMQSQYA